ncbi:DUF6297 family protein [Oerskovia flava]|uniref:DUF6297 family protein n=1 Tax=Oerskovia flava TaxID=2986422 RepID=UPI00223EEA06|nr:DUF6297 family protein [Oerskovia sp. JB1-3-2]
MTGDAPVLQAVSLRVGYGDVQVCAPVDLSLAAGELLAVVGPNGSGKSTLLRALLGLLEPLGGRVTAFGREVDERQPAFRARVAGVLDDDAYFPALTVREHLVLTARGHGVPRAGAVVDGLLDRFGLSDHAHAIPTSLSSGQRRRLLLAAGFARPRELLVLDEPEQRLDPAMRTDLARLLVDEARSGVAVLFATHDQGTAPLDPEPQDPHPGDPRGPLPRLVADPREQLTTGELRALTRAAAVARSGAGGLQLLTEVGYVVVSVVLAAGLLLGVSGMARDVLVAPVTPTQAVLAPGTVQLLATLAVLALGAGLAVRLGPLGVSSAGVRWWVSTPVDRRGLLRASWWRAVALGVVAGAAALALVAQVSGAGPGQTLADAALGAAAGLVVVAGAGLVQPSAAVAAATIRVADVALATVPVLGGLLVVTGAAARASLPTSPLLVVALAAAGSALAVRWSARTDLGAGMLRARSAVADHTGGAALSLDVRELGRALGRADRPARRSRSAAFGWVGGPVGVLLAADGALLLRSPAALAQVVGLGTLLLVAQQLPAFTGGPVLLLLVLAVAGRAAQVAAGGARSAELVPALDALLPLGARATRLARTVWPAAAALVTLVVGTVPLATAGAGTEPLWFALAVPAAAVLGAAAVRAAYRRPPNWAGPLLATPAGGVPMGALSLVTHGPDLALLGTLPLAAAVLVGTPTWTVVGVQVALAAVALVVASRVRAVGSGG